MYPYIYIDFLNLELPTYGLCALVGAAIAIILILRFRKITVLSEDNILDAIIFALLCGFLGAKILYLIKDPPILPLTWDDIKELITTGLVFYGGLLGGLGGLALASLKTKKPFLAFTDVIVPGFCFAHACGRVGCLMAGCCYGVEMEGLFCLQLGGTERLAVQLLEAMFLVILGLTLCLVRRARPRRGILTGLYMTFYALWRFIIEFWRDDDRGFVGALSTSQFIGLFVFAAGILLIFMAMKFRWPGDYLTAPGPEGAAKPGEAADLSATGEDLFAEAGPGKEEEKPTAEEALFGDALAEAEPEEAKSGETEDLFAEAGPDEIKPEKEEAEPEEDLFGDTLAETEPEEAADKSEEEDLFADTDTAAGKKSKLKLFKRKRK